MKVLVLHLLNMLNGTQEKHIPCRNVQLRQVDKFHQVVRNLSVSFKLSLSAGCQSFAELVWVSNVYVNMFIFWKRNCKCTPLTVYFVGECAEVSKSAYPTIFFSRYIYSHTWNFNPAATHLHGILKYEKITTWRLIQFERIAIMLKYCESFDLVSQL